MKQRTKVRTLREAVALIADGDRVAIGGCATIGRPVALAAEIVRQRRRGLRLVCQGGGVDIDMLASAGCAERIDCARDERASDIDPVIARRSSGSLAVPRVVHEKAAVLAGLSAAAAGVPFWPIAGDAAASADAWMKSCTSPFSGERVCCIEALRPDVAILHATMADRDGNVRLASNSMHRASGALGASDVPVDLVLARAASAVIVSVEQIVSGEAIDAASFAPLLRTDQVACVVEAPYGAWPYAFDARYRRDDAMLDEFARALPDSDAFARWLHDSVLGQPDHDALLVRLGARRLLSLTTRLAVNA